MSYCTNCGEQLSNETRFCPKCGQKVDSEAIPIQPVSSNNESPISPSRNSSTETNFTAQSKISNSTPQPQNNSEIPNVRFWYYLDGGIKYGPLNETGIQQAIAAGTITKNTLVWTTGLADWVQAQNTSLIGYITLVVPAVNPKFISDKWVWALATIPLLTNIILFELGVGEPILTIIVIALNCVFIALDISYLKKVNSNPGNWMFLGFLLVPLYLFVRAAKTNKHFACGFVWCALWILSLLPIW